MKRAAILKVLVIVGLSVPLLTLAAIIVPAPETLVAEVKRDGPRAVVSRLWADGKLFEAVLRRIESGDGEWLDVARQLKPGTDGGESESLDYAVALALPRAPSHVLPLIGAGFQVGSICTAPHIEAPLSVVMGHLRAVEKALSTFKTSKYASVRVECLERVRGLRSKLAARDSAAKSSAPVNAPPAARR